MAAIKGMDIESVRTFAGTVQSEASNVEAAVQQLLTRAEGLEWFGTDAENFKGEQIATTRTSMTNLTQALQTMNEILTKNVAEQENTSAA